MARVLISNLLRSLPSTDWITFTIPVRPMRRILGIAFKDSSDETVLLKCKIDENRYKIKDHHKITLRPENPDFAHAHFYISDLEGLLELPGWSFTVTNPETVKTEESADAPTYPGQIPIGALVEVKKSGVLVYVTEYARDFDRTKGYYLSLHDVTDPDDTYVETKEYSIERNSMGYRLALDGLYIDDELTIIRLQTPSHYAPEPAI